MCLQLQGEGVIGNGVVRREKATSGDSSDNQRARSRAHRTVHYSRWMSEIGTRRHEAERGLNFALEKKILLVSRVPLGKAALPMRQQPQHPEPTVVHRVEAQ